jgi:hypothetical protein
MINYENENVLKLILSTISKNNLNKNILNVNNKTIYKISLKVFNRNTQFLSLGNNKLILDTHILDPYSLLLFKNYVIVASYNTIKILDTYKNKCIKTLQANYCINSTIILPTENLAACCYDCINIWETNDSFRHIKAISYKEYQIRGNLTLISNSTIATTATDIRDNYILIIDYVTGRLIHTLVSNEVITNLISISQNKFAFSSGNKIKVYTIAFFKLACFNKKYIYKAKTLTGKRKIESLLIKNNIMLSITEDNVVQLYSIVSFRCLKALRIQSGYGMINKLCLSFLPNGYLVYSDTGRCNFQILDLWTGKCVKDLSCPFSIHSLLLENDDSIICGLINGQIIIYYF